METKPHKNNNRHYLALKPAHLQLQFKASHTNSIETT